MNTERNIFTREQLASLVEDALGEFAPRQCGWGHEVDVWRTVGRDDIEAFLAKWLPWRHLVGIKNLKGQALTPEQLRAWTEDPKRELECIFCGTRLPLDSQFCPRCREYKGIQPHIPGWSEDEEGE